MIAMFDGASSAGRFFNDVLDAINTPIESLDGNAPNDAVLVNLGMRNFTRRDDRSLQLLKQIHHLLQARDRRNR